MQTITIRSKTAESSIIIGPVVDQVERLVGGKNIVFITDTNLNRLYPALFEGHPAIVIGTGETVKTLETVHSIYEHMLRFGVDRSWYCVAVGGGIVTDLAGFAASTFMRGLSYGFVATSLLAQVDASLGGKNGVNFQGYKNMIGLIKQPRFVLCDPSLLATLPRAEIETGFAEIIKHALIGDPDLFSILEHNAEAALALDPDLMETLISRSIQVKKTFVERDEFESGERRMLNFGHTFGHAFEKVTSLPHGRAISVGMTIAATLSAHKALLNSATQITIIELLHRFNLPTRINCDHEQLFLALLKDKKRQNDYVHFVLLTDIGSPRLMKIDWTELKSITDDLQTYYA
ncbi:3-dehydroquinate synthase [bacterium]|nr:3-dehydroquinate synthase [bacterium]